MVYKLHAHLAIALLTLLSNNTLAGQALLSWIPPTQNTDGTPLTDLASYEIWHGCSASGVYPDVEVVLVPAVTYTVTNLPDVGSCYFAMKATNSQGVSSDFSNERTKLMEVLSLPGLIMDTVISWVTSPPQTGIYSLAETDFTGTPVVAGNWSVPGQSLTIDFEVTPRSYPSNEPRIISKATGSATQSHFFMVSVRENKIRFRLKTNGVTSTLWGNATIPLNIKTTGQVTYDGSVMSIFVNGQLDVQLGKTGNMDQSNDEVWVGGNPPDNYRPWDGLIQVEVKQ